MKDTTRALLETALERQERHEIRRLREEIRDLKTALQFAQAGTPPPVPPALSGPLFAVVEETRPGEEDSFHIPELIIHETDITRGGATLTGARERQHRFGRPNRRTWLAQVTVIPGTEVSPPPAPGAMATPNWQHNSGKAPKPRKRPQALRDTRRRRQALKASLGLIPPPQRPPAQGFSGPDLFRVS